MTFDIFGTRARAERDEARNDLALANAALVDHKDCVTRLIAERNDAQRLHSVAEGERDRYKACGLKRFEAAIAALDEVAEIGDSLNAALAIIDNVLVLAATKNPNSTVRNIIKACGGTPRDRVKVLDTAAALRAHTASIRAGVGQ